MYIPWLEKTDFRFPDPKYASPEGIVAAGGDLNWQRLLKAYKNGIFPWPHEDYPLLWFSPDPRNIIELKNFHLSKSLLKIIKKNQFGVQFDCNFKTVVNHCAKIPRPDQAGTWITPEISKGYIDFHNKGYAHSIETYLEGQLVGGLYGVSLGEAFFGESMFSVVSNASKIALYYLIKSNNYSLLDCQIESKHLKMIGGYNISRELFIKKIQTFM